MKSKNLIAIAVASTFGWSAATFAGSGHQAMSSSFAYDIGEAMAWDESGGHLSSIGSTSDGAGGTTFYSVEALSGSDEFASSSLNSDESLALEDGIYSDLYFVSFEPVPMGGWDYYVIDASGSSELVATEEYWLMPTHELALIPSTTDEMVYDLVLVPTSFDDMTAEFGSGIGDSTGE